MRTLGKQQKVAVAAALVTAVILFFGGQIWGFIVRTDARPSTSSSTIKGAEVSTNGNGQQTVMANLSSIKGLEVYDELVGQGDVATAGKSITAHYIGYLSNGTKFDSSVDRNTPFTFILGNGDVIKGWDLGIEGMKVGGVRRLVVSSDYAYGPQGKGPIPPNATLIFEVQLLGVK